MDLAMPRLSDTMEEGTVGRWLKQEGDRIEKGEIIAEIQTDKANMELEAYDGGVLERILVQEGETVAIGEPIAVIGSGADGANGDAPPREPEAQQAEQPQATQHDEPSRQPEQAIDTEARTEQEISGVENAEPTAPTGPQGRIKASPLARRIAQEKGVDLATVQGTGPNGRIDRDDVEQAAAKSPTQQAPETTAAQEARPADDEAAPRPAPAPDGEVKPLTRMQQIVAQRMVASKTQVPHIYLTIDIDMAGAIELRRQVNALGDQAVSYNDVVVKACALALRSHPVVNSSFSPEGIHTNPDVNIGVAVAIEGGLIVPVVHHADRMMLRQIAAESRRLIEAARSNKLGAQDLAGGTFTVSNLGMYGVEEFGAVINQPESAILAVGAITEKPVVTDGEVTIGQRMRVTISADHRVVYGAHAAEFLQTLKRLIENPLNLGY